MAVPSTPSVANLVTEAYNKVGIAVPGATKVTRATDFFLEEVKNDLWTKARKTRGNTRFKSLRTFDVQLTTVGKSKYDFPSDYDEIISMTLLDGTHSDTATAGAAATITLAADEDASEEEAVGNYIYFISGTGADVSDNLRQIIAYNTTTKVATIDRAWTTNPDATTVYVIVDEVIELGMEHVEDIGGLGGSNMTIGQPSGFTLVSEAENERFILDKPADKATYGILVRYYANIHELDLAGTHYARLLQNWRWVFTYGVAAKVAEDEDDDKYGVLTQEYETRVEGLIDKEVPFLDEFEGFEL